MNQTYNEMKEFYRGKRVLVTGHTGFKGSWMCRALVDFGALVYGFSLPSEGENFYELAEIHRDECDPQEDLINAADTMDSIYRTLFIDEASPE